MKPKLIIYILSIMNILSKSVITIESFDIRQNFNECYHESYAATVGSTCNTNWPIQFSLLASDKICINKNKTTQLISPQNILSCLNFHSLPYSCNNTFNFVSQNTTQLIAATFGFFNTNGSQYLNENPYKYDNGLFPDCQNLYLPFQNIN